MKRISICAFLLASSALFAQTPEAVAKANQEYEAGRFPEAIQLYESAVRAGAANAAVFYNLGNAWFRTGEMGQAILNYERALALGPQHPEAEANLRFVRDKARALALKRTWWDRLTARASPDHYAIAGAVSFWIAAFAIAALLLYRRRPAALIGTLVLALLVFAVAAGALYETGNNARTLAIVIGQNIEARLATADNAGSVLALPPGSEIKILSTRGDWLYAALPNDLRGWIPARGAERVL